MYKNTLFPSERGKFVQIVLTRGVVYFVYMSDIKVQDAEKSTVHFEGENFHTGCADA